MPAIYHEGSWLGNATDPEVLVKDTVGWTGKNQAFSQTNNAVIAHIENGISYNVSWIGSATITLKKDSSSGTTITSGSESPLSFTADADYDLYLGSNANVTDIMVWDSRIVDPTYEPYHESVEEEIEQIYADNGVLGAKNLLPNTATSRTVNGVTFTVNADGSVTANGTAAANASVTIATYLTLPTEIIGQNVILTGCPEGGSANGKYFMNAIGFRSASSGDTDTGNGVQINNVYDFTANTATKVYIEVRSGYNAQNLVFKPMLRLASDPDDTYQPYAMTNRELTEKVGPIEITDNWLTLPTDITKGNQYTVFKIGKLIIANIVLCRNAGFDNTEFAIPINSQYQPIKQINANAVFQATQWTSEGSLGYLYVASDLIIRNMQSTPVNFCKVNIAYICK